MALQTLRCQVKRIQPMQQSERFGDYLVAMQCAAPEATGVGP